MFRKSKTKTKTQGPSTTFYHLINDTTGAIHMEYVVIAVLLSAAVVGSVIYLGRTLSRQIGVATHATAGQTRQAEKSVQDQTRERGVFRKVGSGQGRASGSRDYAQAGGSRTTTEETPQPDQDASAQKTAQAQRSEEGVELSQKGGSGKAAPQSSASESSSLVGEKDYMRGEEETLESKAMKEKRTLAFLLLLVLCLAAGLAYLRSIHKK